MTLCRGVRGATTADSNTRDDILTATRQLLALIIRVNDIEPEHVASAVFSLTRDLDAVIDTAASGFATSACDNEVIASVGGAGT